MLTKFEPSVIVTKPILPFFLVLKGVGHFLKELLDDLLLPLAAGVDEIETKEVCLQTVDGHEGVM